MIMLLVGAPNKCVGATKPQSYVQQQRLYITRSHLDRLSGRSVWVGAGASPLHYTKPIHIVAANNGKLCVPETTCRRMRPQLLLRPCMCFWFWMMTTQSPA